MRADRLLSILLLLQTQGRLSARALAERLEVSKRTLDRDMEALSMAGVPVYAIRGRRGGWELTDSYRTDLTGLTEAELRSLILATAPQVLADLGLGDAAERAIVKLLATLPEARRRGAETARAYIHVDPAGWRRREEAALLLPAVEEAVRLGRQMRMAYERMDGSVVDRTVDPLGLVAKGSVWYLVATADGERRTYRVARIRQTEMLADAASRPDGFDLAAYWGQSRASFEARLPAHFATLRVAPEAVRWIDGGWLRYVKVEAKSEPEPDGWIRCRVQADSQAILEAMALGLGTRAEVVEPAQLRRHVLREARAIAERSGAPASPA
jgi:predicted DNA-binding transcriptional regulator YafY